MRKIKISTCPLSLLIAACCSSHALGQSDLQQKLTSQYALTQTTAAKDAIITAGAVLILKKGNLITSPIGSAECQNTYKDGRITQSGIGLFTCNRIPSEANPSRIFVPGEKLWVTQIDVRRDGVFFDLFTDPYGDTRYRALLKFPFPKGSTPPTEQIEKEVADVFAVQGSDSGNSPQQSLPAGQQFSPTNMQPASPPRQEAPPPPIAPPPPPPADPKTIGLKETVDQVVAAFGQPEKIVKLGAKQIYVYKDMKVTFVGGKVTGVE